MRVKHLTKKAYERWHAKWRAWERYGINFNARTRTETEQQITRGTAKHVSTTSNNRAVFLVDVEGKRAKVVWDRKRKTIITFLPNKTNGEE